MEPRHLDGVESITLALTPHEDCEIWGGDLQVFAAAGIEIYAVSADWKGLGTSGDVDAIRQALQNPTRIELDDIEHRRLDAEGGDKPDMTVLRRAVIPAPRLPLESVFPGPLAKWVRETAETKSAPVDYVFLGLLVGVAGVVGATRWVSPWQGWEEPSILWGGVVGMPSSGKTPGLDTIRNALTTLEHVRSSNYPDILREWETQKVAAEANAEAWESEARTAAKNGDAVPQKPEAADIPSKPAPQRCVVNDATIEAVAILLAGNPRGLVHFRDEIAAWAANLGKYGDGDRAFFLECFGGRASVVDRKKHADPIRLPHLALSFIGGIQPDRASSLLLDGDDDGLAARFLLVWPDPVAPKRPNCAADERMLLKTLRRLFTLDFVPTADGTQIPVTLPVEEPALNIFQEWRESHFKAAQFASGLLASALGKAPGQVLRLALVLELLAWASGPEDNPSPTYVSGRWLGAALDLMDGYFIPMMRRVLGEASVPPLDRNAATLASAILERRPSCINARQVRREWRLPGLKEASAVTATISALVEARWLIPAAERAGGGPGRRRADYVVDPRVFEVAP